MVGSNIRFRIDELFAENGIVIAFPQLDVHLNGAIKGLVDTTTRIDSDTRDRP